MKKITNKTQSMLSIEAKTKEDIEETLRRLYVDEGMLSHDIAKHLNISYVTTLKWLSQAGIYSRKLRVDS